MSTQHGTPASSPGIFEAAPVRPATLSTAVWGSVAVALLSLVGAILMIVKGKASIEAYLDETAGADLSGLVKDVMAEQLDEAYHRLVIKAGVAIALAVLVLIFALTARGGSMVARILLTVALVVNMCAGSGLQLGDRDVLPSGSVAIAALTPLLSLVMIVLLFLPANNRYAAARARGR
ncbi:hypothetical protein [Dactylosporangium sp. CA-092794]|uniref:hypothetical protein n=1 Tax=Dactylosporangium sp. CA-092794 TaxID=3239929 RepID=UPI003D8AADA6